MVYFLLLFKFSINFDYGVNIVFNGGEVAFMPSIKLVVSNELFSKIYLNSFKKISFFWMLINDIYSPSEKIISFPLRGFNQGLQYYIFLIDSIKD